MHPLFQQLKNNPEPALNAEHPAPFAPGNAPKALRNIPKDKPVHATHTEARGVVVETPQQYIENGVKPNAHGI